MAEPLIGNVQFASAGPGAGQVTVTKPTGLVNGDVILLLVLVDMDVTPSLTWPSGFTQVFTPAATGGNGIAAATRKVDGTEGADFTVSDTTNGSGWLAWAARVYDVDGDNPIDVVGTLANGPNSTLAITGVTTTGADRRVFYLTSFDGADGAPMSPDGSWTEHDERTLGSGGNGISGSYGSLVVASAGASGTVTITYSATDGNHGIQFAMKPSGGAQTVAVGLATATDTPLALGTTLKNKAVGLNTTTETAQPVTQASSSTQVGLNVETNTAFGVSKLKEKTFGIIAETTQAPSVVRLKSADAVTAVLEDDALSVTTGQASVLGLTEGADTPLALTKRKTLVPGQSSVATTAFGVSFTKVRALALLTTTEQAFPVTINITGTTVVQPLLTEVSDTPLAITPMRTYAVGQPADTETPLAIVSAPKTKHVNIVYETSRALRLLNSGAVSVGQPMKPTTASIWRGMYG